MSWLTKKLGEVLEINYGKGLPKDNRVDSGKYFAYGSNGPVYNTDESLTNGEVIVIGRKGTTGALYFVSEPCWPIDTTFFAIPKSDASLKFVYYLLRTKKLPRLAIVTGVPGINRTTLANINIQLPPLATQKQIVERLDKIAEAQKLNDELIQKTDELFQSLLHKELNPAGKNWEVKKMEVLVKNVKIGPFGSALKIAELSDNGPVRVLFIENVVNNKFELAKEKYISEKKYKELEVYTVEPDDILITMMGTIGRTCITPKNLGRAIISSHLIKVTPNKKIAIPEYLNFSLHSPYVTDQIRRKAKGAIMKGLNSKILRNLDIPLPSLEIQKQIVAKLSAVQDYKKQLLGQKSKLKELFDSVLSNSMNQSGEY